MKRGDTPLPEPAPEPEPDTDDQPGLFEEED
jgi:hypothetical protein